MIRVALHNHSLWSYDGRWELAKIARFFGAMGFDAVMMSEHDTGFDPDSYDAYRAACAAASTDRCKIIPGIEYSSPDNRIHVPVWGVPRFLGEHREITATLQDVRAAGGVAIFAHPVRKDAWEAFDPAWVPYLSGIELWNRKSDGIAPGVKAREMIAATGLAPTVGCDFHRLRNFYPLSMRMAGAAAEISEEMLVEALRQGALKPHVFGAPLLDEAGNIRPLAAHGRAEGLRKRAVRLVRGSKSKRKKVS